jgi:hypothetical protein
METVKRQITMKPLQKKDMPTNLVVQKVMPKTNMTWKV